jgi:hypothetical protein
MSDPTLQICSSQSIKVSPFKGTDARDLQLLDVLAELFEIQEGITVGSQKIGKIVGTLSQQAKTEIGKVFNNPRFRTYTPTAKFQEVVKATSDPSDLSKLAKIIEITKGTDKKIQLLKTKLSPFLSSSTMSVLDQIALLSAKVNYAIVEIKKLFPHSIKQIIRGVKKSKVIRRFIRRICLRHPQKKIIKPVGPLPKKKPWHANLNYSLRVGPIFSYRISGQDTPEVLAGENRGIGADGTASINYSFNNKYRLQLDYSSNALFGIIGEDVQDKVTSASDLAMISAIMRPLSSLDLMVQAGWQYFHTDYPSERTEGLNAGLLKFRINARPIKKVPISFNFDGSLLVGEINSTFPIENQLAVRALVDMGASYLVKLKSLSLIPHVSGRIGYLMDRELLAYGGAIGLSLAGKEHEGNVAATYNNVDGLTARLRYMFKRSRYSVGAQASYNMYNKNLVKTELEQQIVAAELFGQVGLVKLFGRYLGLRLVARYAHELDSGASNVTVGLDLTYGSLLPVRPSIFTPNSLSTMAEDR